MSGGSWDYLCWKVDDAADRLATDGDSVRRAFGRHLKLVAKALRDVEWVDSGDMGKGDEVPAIRAVLSEERVAWAQVVAARDAVELAHNALAEIRRS